MVQTGDPVRIIYAKLTTTGAYDVVARTANIPLDRARAFAEKLLPGNPPLDAVVGEEVAHVRPSEGGHVVLRFARYDWSDGDRGDVFITDILWVSDDDFRRARNHAFALVPRTDRVFDELTELPPVTVAERTQADDLARIAALHAVAGETRTVIASAAAADPVLLMHGGDRARALELFTLLLPPGLRASLTFQTQSFRVPVSLPRIALVDRVYANLRAAPWKVLPSVEVDVPLELADRLVALADEPASLALAHELYDDAYDDAVDLRTAIHRLTRLATVATALQRRDVPHALRELAGAHAPERAAALRRLRRIADAAAFRNALVELQRQGDAGSELLLALLRDDAGYEDADTTGALVDALPAGASDELVGALAARAARSGDLPRVIALLETDRRAIAARLPLDDERVPENVRRLGHAVRDASGSRLDLDAAGRLLAAARAVLPALPPASATVLHRICRDVLVDAVERTHASTAAAAALSRLQDGASAYVTTAGSTAVLPSVLAPHELASPAALEAAARFATEYPEGACAALGATLITRALDAHASGDAAQGRRIFECAVTLLSRAGGTGRELARQLLAERNVREHDLVAIPGADGLLALLGGNAQQASIARRLVGAIGAAAAGQEQSVQELAGAIFAAHVQRIRITPRSELSDRVQAALRQLHAARQERAVTAATEICLELLSLITDPAHFQALEDAAVGNAMSIRLQRLDRSVVDCRNAEAEDRYERYALAVEAADVPLDAAARDRLRDALGTRGLKRRLLQVVSSVIERDAS